jgi:hypothetical protein
MGRVTGGDREPLSSGCADPRTEVVCLLHESDQRVLVLQRGP